MRKIYYFFIALIGFTIDQAIKNFVINSPRFDGKIFVNQNFAWGLPVPNSVIIILMIGIIIFLFFLITRKFQSCVWIIIAGALSNLIDRVLFGGVIDYIHTPFGGIINLADIMISVGVLILLVGRSQVTKLKVIN